MRMIVGKVIDMKYTAKRLEDDEYPQVKFYAVFTGKKYFIDTVTTSIKDAERMAITMSMRYHYNECTRIHLKAEEDGVDFDGASWSDILC